MRRHEDIKKDTDEIGGPKWDSIWEPCIIPECEPLFNKALQKFTKAVRSTPSVAFIEKLMRKVLDWSAKKLSKERK